MLTVPNGPLKVVILPISRLELEIRRVDVFDIGLDEARSYASRISLMIEAQVRAAEGVSAAVQSATTPPRPETPPRHPPAPNKAEIQRELVRMTQRQMIKAALEGTRNSYAEVLLAFKATEEMPDLGMGQDYAALIDLIVEHSGSRRGVSALPPEEAETFPGRVGQNP